MSSLIVKTLGLNITKLSVEGKITFDEKSGEFYVNRTITRGSTFTQAIQIAKFDFLNIYIPSKWFVNKKNLSHTNCKPYPKERIIQPFYSKRKGCQIIPISEVVQRKGSSFDINILLLKAVNDFDEEYPKLIQKIQERMSSEFRTPYDLSRKILRWLQNNELQKGEHLIYGKKFYVMEWNVSSRKYFVLYQHNSFWNEFLFFIKTQNGYAYASDVNHQETFERDLLLNGKSETINTIVAIHVAANLRNGYRLSKFLLNCAMEDLNIQANKVEDSFYMFTISYKDTQLAFVREEKEDEKTRLIIHLSNCIWNNELKLRGKDSNAKEYLQDIKTAKEAIC